MYEICHQLLTMRNILIHYNDICVPIIIHIDIIRISCVKYDYIDSICAIHTHTYSVGRTIIADFTSTPPP